MGTPLILHLFKFNSSIDGARSEIPSNFLHCREMSVDEVNERCTKANISMKTIYKIYIYIYSYMFYVAIVGANAAYDLIHLGAYVSL